MRGLSTRKQGLIFGDFSSFDFCFIQETLISDDKSIKKLSSQWPGTSFWSPAIGKQGGVTILISERFDGKVLSWLKDSGGRILSLLVSYADVTFNVVNIYAPTNPTERRAFFECLHEFFLPADNIILGGDFNCYESDLDKLGGNVSVAKYLSDFRAAFRLVDVWRKRHRRKSEMTWFNADLSIGSRLDKFFLSPDLLGSVVSCDISPFCFSDHDYVNLSLGPSGLLPRGPGIWNFNNSFLNDEFFCEYISGRIFDLASCKTAFESVKLWWDFFKSSLKLDIISFAREKRKQLCHDRVVLTNRLIKLKQRRSNGDSSVSHEIIFTESQLSALHDRAIEGVKIRSRCQWFEEGEKPSRYFFSLERERIEKNHLSSILDSDGNEVFTREEIESAHVRFYTDLFSPEAIDSECKQTLLDEIASFLSDSDRDICEGTLALSELTASVKSLNNNRAPGPDGLTVEFYAKFWDLLGPLLLDVINFCFSECELCGSMKSSATRLVFKKRGDVKNLKNWRPISLLNVDYKICSKAITLRLSKVLDSIIVCDQTCSIPGRSISSNIVTLRDTLDYIEKTGETGILVSLDQEKAFDRVDRVFLMDLLSRFGFGPDFCNWLKTFYTDASMQIILNGWLTQKIPLLRGVRQGDPLSPLLYILCVEVLACQIRNSPNIKGFLLPGAKGRQFKVRQYADDTTSLVKDFSSLKNLFDIVSIYERGSGAKLNRSKTEAMWLGSWRERSDEPLGLTWVRKMKIVGVVFGTVPVESDNWQPKINKLEKTLNLWKSRSLSLIGKSLIINVLALSKLLYLAKVLIPPSWVFARINQLIWPFLWGSKIETVSRNTCYLSDRSGGLNISNFELKCSALRISSLVFTLNSPDDPCFFLCKYFVGSYLAPLRVEWRPLRDNSAPSASSPTLFYNTCLSDLGKIGKLVNDNALLSSRNVYLHLLKVKSSPPLLPLAWSSFLGPGFSIKDHWARVRDLFTENYKNDILWLITLRGTKVRDSLKNWGYINSDRCATCGRKETIDHCFVNCCRVKRVWASFAPTLSNLLCLPFTVNILTVFFFRWEPRNPERDRIALFLIKSALYAIWKFRNKATFDNASDDSSAIIRYIQLDIKSRVKLDHLRLPAERFKATWVLSSLVSINDNGVLSFNLG